MRLVTLTLLTVLSHGLFGQDENRFKNFQAIKHPESGVLFLEAEGYDIFVESLDFGLNEKGISKIKKKYSAKNAQLTTDSVTNLKVLAMTEQKNGVTVYFTYYLHPVSEESSTIIGFIRPKARDIGLERDFVNSQLSNKIPSFVYTSLYIDSIDFVGRKIDLGSACRWMSPHNVQCPNYGQMNWAIFDNQKQAEEYRDTHFEMTKNKNLTDIKEEKWITVKLEGQETKALKTRVKIQLPKFAMGGSNTLIAYYVTAQVRGKYVTCILSHYTDDVGADKLPPLLSEVMELIE
jgi:hypothetical protein